MKKISIITLFMLLVLMPAAAYRVVHHAQSNFTQNGEPVAEAPTPTTPAVAASKSSAQAEKVKGYSMQMTNYGKGAGISVGRGASATGSGGSADSSAGGSGVGGGMGGGAAGAANAASAEMNEQRKKCQEKLNCTYCLDEKQKDRCQDCRMTLMHWGMFASATASYYRENPDRNAWTCNWNLNSNEVLVQKNSGSNNGKSAEGKSPSGRDGNVLRPDVSFERDTSVRTEVINGRKIDDVIHPATDLSRGGSSGTGGTSGRNGNTISPTGGRSSGSDTSKTTLTRSTNTGNTRASQTPVTTRTRAESLK